MKKTLDFQDDINVLQKINEELLLVSDIDDLISKEYLEGQNNSIFSNGKVPYLGLLRMTMPIAESIGSLVYDNESSIKNLLYVLKKLSKNNEGYGKYKYILIQLYRHSLIHSFSVKSILIGKLKISWSLNKDDYSEHLKVEVKKGNGTVYIIHFNPSKFISDLKLYLFDLCILANKKKWKGKLARRYLQKTKLNLNSKRQIQKYNIRPKEINEINKEVVRLRKIPQNNLFKTK